ncbi:hypothetical protein [Rhodoferax sp.]|uniref:hypothetical protein n=1 Tax=Rhodoferax sp. TaxID=50421 RepID=UPI001A087996|nr:hypothetical protein [Rhodoferax sp.]MBE0474298.1 hypothetical protein [Rhodoferax sp.]
MDEKTHWLDQPRNVKLLWRGFLVLLLLTVLAEFFVPMHPHFEIESVFGFYAWGAFLACALLVLVAKGLTLLLQRPHTYYGKDHD